MIRYDLQSCQIHVHVNLKVAMPGMAPLLIIACKLPFVRQCWSQPMSEDWPSTLKPAVRPTPLKSYVSENGSANSQTSTHIVGIQVGIMIHRESFSLTLRVRRDDMLQYLYQLPPMHLQHGMEMHLSELPSYLKIDHRWRAMITLQDVDLIRCMALPQSRRSLSKALCLKHPNLL